MNFKEYNLNVVNHLCVDEDYGGIICNKTSVDFDNCRFYGLRRFTDCGGSRLAVAVPLGRSAVKKLRKATSFFSPRRRALQLFSIDHDHHTTIAVPSARVRLAVSSFN